MEAVFNREAIVPREDPMKLEVSLSWSPQGDESKMDSPVFLPSADWLPADSDPLEAEPKDATTQVWEPVDCSHLTTVSLLGPPPVPERSDPPTARRSSRLAAKKSTSRVGAAKQASVLLEEKMAALGQVSKTAGGTARERLATIFAQPLQPEVVQALKALTGIEGKAQVDLPALNLSAEDLAALAGEVVAA